MNAPDLFDEDTFDMSLVERWSDRTHNALTSLQRIWEVDIAKLLHAAAKLPEQKITQFFGRVVDSTQSATHDRHLIFGTDVRENRYIDDNGRKTRITPDLAVVSAQINADGLRAVEIGVELKGNAAVNYINCPKNVHVGYSNQPVCYANGCWLNTDLSTASEVKYVWLAPESDRGFPLRHGLVSNDVLLHSWGADRAALARQEQAWVDFWHFASLEELCAELKDYPAIVAPIEAWLVQLGK